MSLTRRGFLGLFAAAAVGLGTGMGIAKAPPAPSVTPPASFRFTPKPCNTEAELLELKWSGSLYDMRVRREQARARHDELVRRWQGTEFDLTPADEERFTKLILPAAKDWYAHRTAQGGVLC